jgi:GTP-binding protein
VWLVATADVASLLAFRDHPHRRASDGTHGQGKKRHGRSGEDVTVGVPQGTVVKTLSGDTVADLAAEGERWLAARGGRGGRGNARFLSNRRRAPSFAEQGEIGEERWLDVELKLMADVALVGMPNAGKSTLISIISAARPKIAEYPFTTLEPHLGVVRTGSSTEPGDFVVADIPGLVAGASNGKGLGHRFLRHVERARVLVVLVDLAPMDGPLPADQERILVNELGRYQPELLDRPRIVVGSKVDLLDPDTAGTGWEPEIRISAVTGDGLSPFVTRVAGLVEDARAARAPIQSVVIHRPEPEGVDVERSDDGGFVVRGRRAERAVAVNDLTNAQALEYVQHRLHRLGVDRALARAGAREGDVVHVGGFTFTYEPDQ